MPPLRKGITAIKISATVPDPVGGITLTPGTGSSTVDTFSWSAPASNGAAITKYGYQTTTNSGSTYATEIETASTSVAITTSYTASSYKIRIRAYNSVGWGPYSSISTSGTAAWALGAVTRSQTCSGFGCSCGACACGSNNGTNSTATQSRTCYTWTRTGNTTSSDRNSDGTTACSSSYGGCSGGTCSSCSGCGTWSRATQNWGSGSICNTGGGSCVPLYWYSGGNEYFYSGNPDNVCGCCGWCDAMYVVERCSATGALRYTSGPYCYEC